VGLHRWSASSQSECRPCAPVKSMRVVAAPRRHRTLTTRRRRSSGRSRAGRVADNATALCRRSSVCRWRPRRVVPWCSPAFADALGRCPTGTRSPRPPTLPSGCRRTRRIEYRPLSARQRPPATTWRSTSHTREGTGSSPARYGANGPGEGGLVAQLVAAGGPRRPERPVRVRSRWCSAESWDHVAGGRAVSPKVVMSAQVGSSAAWLRADRRWRQRQAW